MDSDQDTVINARKYLFRLDDSTSTERINALVEIQSLAKQSPKVIGDLCLERILSLLYESTSSDEYLESLEVVLILVKCRDNIAAMSNVEKILSASKNVELLLDLLEHSDFTIAVMANELLSEIHHKNPKLLESLIQDCPAGMSKLLQLLSDNSKEEVRNQVLIFIQQLTATNEEMKKTVVFNEGFEILFSIIKSEGGISDNGPVIQDCLHICSNLLSHNETCQRLFFGMGQEWIIQLSEFFEVNTLETQRKVKKERGYYDDDEDVDMTDYNTQLQNEKSTSIYVKWYEDLNRVKCAILALLVLQSASDIINIKHQIALTQLLPYLLPWLIRQGPSIIIYLITRILELMCTNNTEISTKLLNTDIKYQSLKLLPISSSFAMVQHFQLSSQVMTSPRHSDEIQYTISLPCLISELYILSIEPWTLSLTSTSSTIHYDEMIPTTVSINTAYYHLLELLIQSDPTFPSMCIQSMLAPKMLSMMDDDLDTSAEGGLIEEQHTNISIGKLILMNIYDSCQLIPDHAISNMSPRGTNTAVNIDYTTFIKSSNIFLLLLLHGDILVKELCTVLNITQHFHNNNNQLTTTTTTTTTNGHSGSHQENIFFLPYLFKSIQRCIRHPSYSEMSLPLLRILSICTYQCERVTLQLFEDPVNFSIFELASPTSDLSGVSLPTQILTCFFLGNCLLSLSSSTTSSTTTSSNNADTAQSSDKLTAEKLVKLIDIKIGLSRFVEILKKPSKCKTARHPTTVETHILETIYITSSYSKFYEIQESNIRQYIYDHYSGLHQSNVSVSADDHSPEKVMINLLNSRIEELEEKLQIIQSSNPIITSTGTVNGAAVGATIDMNSSSSSVRDKLASLESKNTHLEFQIKSTTDFNSQLSDENNTLKVQMNTLENQLNELKNMNNQLAYEKQYYTEQLSAMNAIQDENTQLKSQLMTVENLLATTTNNNNSNNSNSIQSAPIPTSTTTDQNDEIVYLKESVVRLSQEKQNLNDLIYQKDRKISLLEDELRSPVPYESHKEKQVIELENRNADLVNQIWKIENEYNEIKKDFENNIENHYVQIQTYQELLPTYEDTISMNKQTILELTQQIEQLQGENLLLQTKLSHMTIDTSSRPTDADAAADNSVMIEEVTRQLREKDHIITTLSSQLETLNQDSILYNVQLQEKEAVIHTQKQAILRYEVEMSQYEDQITTLTNQLNTTAGTTSEPSMTTIADSELTAMSSTIQNLEQKIKEYELNIVQCNDTITQHNEANMFSQQQITSLQQELQELQATATIKQSEGPILHDIEEYEITIDKLSTELMNYTQKYSESTHLIQTYETHITTLETQLKSLEQEKHELTLSNQQLLSQYDSMNQQVIVNKQEIKYLYEERNRLNMSINSLQDNINTLMKTEQEIQVKYDQEFNDIHIKYNTLESTYHNLHVTYTQLQGEYTQLKIQQTEQENQIQNDLQVITLDEDMLTTDTKTIEQLEQDKELISRMYETILEEKDSLSRQYKTVLEEKDTLKDKNQVLVQENQTLVQSNDELKQSINDLNIRYNVVNEDKLCLENTISIIQIDHKELKDTLEALKTEYITTVQDYENKLSHMSIELQSHQSQTQVIVELENKYHQELENIKTQYREEINGVQAMLQTAEQEKETVQSQYTSLSQEYEAVKSQYTYQMDEYLSLKRSYEEYIESTTLTIENLKTTIVDKEQELITLQEEVDSWKSKYSDIEQELIILQEEVDSWKSKYSDIDPELVEIMKQRVYTLENEIIYYETIISEMESYKQQIYDLTTDSNRYQDEVVELQRQIEESKKDKIVLITQFDQSMNQLYNEVSTLKTSHQKELQQMTSAHQQQTQDIIHSSEEKWLMLEQQYEYKIDEYRLQLGEKERQYEDVLTHNKELQATIHQQSYQLVEREKQLDEYKSIIIPSLHQEIVVYKDKVNTYDTLQLNYTTIKQEYQTLQQSHQKTLDLYKELEVKYTTISQEYSILMSNKLHIENEYKELKLISSIYNNDKQKYEQKIHDLLTQNQDLVNTQHNLVQEKLKYESMVNTELKYIAMKTMQEEINKLNHTITQLQSELQQKEMTSAKIHEKIQKYEGELYGLKLAYESLSAEYDTIKRENEELLIQMKEEKMKSTELSRFHIPSKNVTMNSATTTNNNVTNMTTTITASDSHNSSNGIHLTQETSRESILTLKERLRIVQLWQQYIQNITAYITSTWKQSSTQLRYTHTSSGRLSGIKVFPMSYEDDIKLYGVMETLTNIIISLLLQVTQQQLYVQSGQQSTHNNSNSNVYIQDDSRYMTPISKSKNPISKDTPPTSSSTASKELKLLHSEILKERRRLNDLQEEHNDLLGLLAQQEIEVSLYSTTIQSKLGYNVLQDTDRKVRQIVTKKYGSYIDYRGVNNTSTTNMSL